jgi:hypothetical protein
MARVCVMVIATLLMAAPSSAQVAIRQQAKLVESDSPAAGDGFGNCVAIDGDTAIVGAPNKQVGTHQFEGEAYVFARTGATWTHQTTLTPNDGVANDHFGRHIALDHDTALIGSPLADSTDTTEGNGAAYIFTRAAGDTWSQRAKLTGDNSGLPGSFGWSVALAAYVFSGSGTTWTSQGKLIDSGGAVGDAFGYAVALDGGAIVMGAPAFRPIRLAPGFVDHPGAFSLFSRAIQKSRATIRSRRHRASRCRRAMCRS